MIALLRCALEQVPFSAMIKFFYVKDGDSQIVHTNQIQVTVFNSISPVELGQ